MNTSSTRTKPTSADVLSRHDANVKRRFRRALLLSLFVNFVALGAFALSKTAPLAENLGAQTPMKWSFSEAPTARANVSTSSNKTPSDTISNTATSQRATSQRATSQRATSSTRSDDNSPRERIARVNFASAFDSAFDASPRREKAHRSESRVKNTLPERRRNSESARQNYAPRRVVMRGQSRETEAFLRSISPTRGTKPTVSESPENRYPLEHSDHSPHNFPNSTSSTRVGNENKNTTSSKTARASSASNGSFSSRAQASNGGSDATNINENSSRNSETSDFLRSSSGKIQGEESRQSDPSQNGRNESNRESSTRTTPKESAPQPEKSRPEPRAEIETPRKTETERALAAPIQRKVEVRKVEVREAEVVSQQKVKIPRRLRRDKRKTSVRVEFDVDERGQARARVAESSGDRDLDEVVLKAARKTRFKPRTEDGVATKTTKKMRYDINVDDGDGADNDEENE